MKVRLKLHPLFFSALAGQPSAQLRTLPTFFPTRLPPHSRSLPSTFLSRGSGGGGSASLRKVHAPPTIIDLKLCVVVAIDLRRRSVIIVVLYVVVLVVSSI
jgi:hypothetical protein